MVIKNFIISIIKLKYDAGETMDYVMFFYILLPSIPLHFTLNKKVITYTTCHSSLHHRTINLFFISSSTYMRSIILLLTPPSLS